MMYVEIVFTILQIVNRLIMWLQEKQLIDQGRAEAIADMALAIAAKVRTRDEIRAKLDAMSEPEVDAELLRLGNARDVQPPAR